MFKILFEIFISHSGGNVNEVIVEMLLLQSFQVDIGRVPAVADQDSRKKHN